MRVRILPVVLLFLATGFSLAAAQSPPVELVVPSTQVWTDTGIDVAAGQRLRIDAEGLVRITRLKMREAWLGPDFDDRVGPEGTYRWRRDDESDERKATPFPLPAGAMGPYPAYALIGRVGADGEPFHVGRAFRGAAPRGGRLWLGINDGDAHDNRGQFHVKVVLDAPEPEPSAPPPVIQPDGQAGPRPDARVLLLYVDGLRPDVMREMAAAGYLPTIKQVFLDGGLDCANAFTTFPSNTLVANGALFTGLLPDRTGIKSQNQFERTAPHRPRGQLSEWLPDWLLARTSSGPRVSDLLDKFAPENTYHSLRQRGIRPLSVYLRAHYQCTVLPIAQINPPIQWLHRALNTVTNPFAAAVRIPHDLDRINAEFVIDELLGDPDTRVIAAWFPMVDKVSHHSPRGQFGGARRELAVFDRLLARILARLRQVGWDRSTYLILLSDHGHIGGERAVNRPCNLAADFFYRRMGWNVRVVGEQWTVPGLDPARFVFLDHQAWAQAAIYLPKTSYQHGPWQRNTLAELMSYQAGSIRGPVNLLETLAAFRPEEAPGLANPVDLVLVKLDDAKVLVYRSATNQAIIHIDRDAAHGERYRYEPVQRISQDADGRYQWQPGAPGEDPLGYVRDPAVQRAVGNGSVMAWLQQPHDAREWLAATAMTDYPDAIVGMAKFFSWQSPVQDLGPARDPDLLVTAARGWTFRSDGTEGTDHGSPLPEAMRMTLCFSGPGIRHGVLLEPHRIVDVMPTILTMVGTPYHAEQLDGRAITGIYEQ